jgi:selenocysteine lyase/cysteine desulfurase
LRVSFSWDNTLEEVDRLAEALRLADHTLVRRP